MDAFHSGRATTLVATDIAARGIHVDDVALVVHADPPVEHKAYLHRSGRTARAGAAGTVITLMTDEQVRDVRDLTRAAGIKPTITRIDGPRHPMLASSPPASGSSWPVASSSRPPTSPSAALRWRRSQPRPLRWPAAAPAASRARGGQQRSGGQPRSASGRQPARVRRRQARPPVAAASRSLRRRRSRHSAASFSSGRR